MNTRSTVVVRFVSGLPEEKRNAALAELTRRSFEQDSEFGLVPQSSGMPDTLCARGTMRTIDALFYEEEPIDGITQLRIDTSVPPTEIK